MQQDFSYHNIWLYKEIIGIHEEKVLYPAIWSKTRQVILNLTSLTAASSFSQSHINEFSYCYFVLIHFPLFTTFSNFSLNISFSHSLLSFSQYPLPSLAIYVHLNIPFSVSSYSLLLIIHKTDFANYSL